MNTQQIRRWAESVRSKASETLDEIEMQSDDPELHNLMCEVGALYDVAEDLVGACAYSYMAADCPEDGEAEG